MDWQDEKKKRPIVRFSSNELLKKQLNFANNLKIHENTLNWSIFGIFLAANVLLVVTLFQNYNYPLKMVFTIVGLFLSLIWIVIQIRALEFRTFYDELVFRLEEELKIPEEFKTKQFTKNIIGLEGGLMIFLPFFVLIGWLLILIFVGPNSFPETVTKTITINYP